MKRCSGDDAVGGKSSVGRLFPAPAIRKKWDRIVSQSRLLLEPGAASGEV